LWKKVKILFICITEVVKLLTVKSFEERNVHINEGKIIKMKELKLETLCKL
jgi:hypothetical protein